MADTVNINPDSLLKAATAVAAHLSAAAIPPADALPPGAAPSPADIAAAGVAQIVDAKIASAQTVLDERGPTLQKVTTFATGGLSDQDAVNAGHIAALEHGSSTRQ